VTTVALGFGIGVQSANFLVLFGAIDRLGGFYVLVSVRELAPIVCMIIVAGVAGTAFTADLGARKIREELDALQVLGVDPVKNLVVPRFLALMLVTALFDVYALICGILGGALVTIVDGEPLGPFWATFFSNASTTDLWGSVVKTTLFGAIIAIVCCYKGMTASGGAEGVGRAVNQAVVTTFLTAGGVQLRLHADAARDPPGAQPAALSQRGADYCRPSRASRTSVTASGKTTAMTLRICCACSSVVPWMLTRLTAATVSSTASLIALSAQASFCAPCI
jgi:phospholipid/cholesterol/gamma-HCH transport system permease protein